MSTPGCLEDRHRLGWVCPEQDPGSVPSASLLTPEVAHSSVPGSLLGQAVCSVAPQQVHGPSKTPGPFQKTWKAKGHRGGIGLAGPLETEVSLVISRRVQGGRMAAAGLRAARLSTLRPRAHLPRGRAAVMTRMQRDGQRGGQGSGRQLAGPGRYGMEKGPQVSRSLNTRHSAETETDGRRERPRQARGSIEFRVRPPSDGPVAPSLATGTCSDLAGSWVLVPACGHTAQTPAPPEHPLEIQETRAEREPELTSAERNTRKLSRGQGPGLEQGSEGARQTLAAVGRLCVQPLQAPGRAS